ncbi:TorD/DmsD family molecular chaperone [Aurantimonas marina]|uniref:TorD/DmsD family molecular chaperone n=1 Tax=Aurantimonas marina TaxID=2780508 RepID=UPI0019CFF2FD|nr:molecular chaperone TorD family protein [Aurantimonas marina]
MTERPTASSLSGAASPDSAPSRVALDPVDAFRVQHYGLLTVLTARAPRAETLALVAELSGDSTPLGRSHTALAEAARRADPARLEREYFNLFIGVGRGELVPYGSYYLTGFLREKPLARLRQDLARLGIERAENLVELEDHVGVLCEIMAGLIGGRFAASESATRNFFARHLAPWMDRFFADLEMAPSADFYRCVGRVGRSFMTIEADSQALVA